MFSVKNLMGNLSSKSNQKKPIAKSIKMKPGCEVIVLNTNSDHHLKKGRVIKIRIAPGGGISVHVRFGSGAFSSKAIFNARELKLINEGLNY